MGRLAYRALLCTATAVIGVVAVVRVLRSRIARDQSQQGECHA